LWPAGTLCFTIAANIGDTAILGIPACFPDSIIGFTPYPDKADVVFVKYALDYAKLRFSAISKGATQDNLSLEKLLSQDLLIPSPPTQRRIASILGAYDDLIEVNRRRIALLEEMARGLFEEWFVRFRFPGHENVTILDTPDGPLPQGWRYDTLGKVAAINTATLRPANAPAEIGYIDIASVSPGQIDAINHMPFAEAPGRARRIVTDGSILWSNVRPNRRSFAVVLEPTPNLIASTGFTVLDARETSFSYLYHWVTTDNFVGYLVGNAQGAAYPAVTAATFERAAILLPASSLAKRFTDFAEPMLRLADSLRKANVSLAASRDLLLPRLISGQLSVAQAEHALEIA
jgi:type I restriction enzyme S subunit